MLGGKVAAERVSGSSSGRDGDLLREGGRAGGAAMWSDEKNGRGRDTGYGEDGARRDAGRR